MVTWGILDDTGDTWGYLGNIKGSPLRVPRSQNPRGDPGGAKVASALIPQIGKGRLLLGLGSVGTVRGDLLYGKVASDLNPTY